MVSDKLMLKVQNVSKVYKLGEIGGTTLRDELQRLTAKIRKKDDPTKKVGSKNYNKGDKFKALDNISFEVKKGERIGIIGHNGAGKSTLLKLISRVTGPSEGTIYLDGRIASMLEVGTGFHPELTGRENVYVNGAILGMTKKEIDSKMEDIIDFSEVRDFIDTPVKRYSSGMYVKLAFSVAAHLNSEILIMDEVLAVGDVNFQKKCLNKMKSVSENDDKTILYVSHNMSTIRELCDRVIVLDHGKIIYDGDVEKGIANYMGINAASIEMNFDDESHKEWKDKNVTIKNLFILNKDFPAFFSGEAIKCRLLVCCNLAYENVALRFEISNSNEIKIASSFSNSLVLATGDNDLEIEFSTKHLVPGRYKIDIVLYHSFGNGNQRGLDGVYPGMIIDIYDKCDAFNKLNWKPVFWGNIHLDDISVITK